MFVEVSFGECEHEGDLSRYIRDLERSGAKCGSSDINQESEVGHVYIDVPVEKEEEFKKKFSATDSYEFSNLRYIF
jgi:hypothetical protein